MPATDSDRREQAQAIAAYSFASAGGGAVGPLLGGVLTDLLSWHWIFFINAPIGAALVLVGLRALPGDRGAGMGKGIDFLGSLLVTSGTLYLQRVLRYGSLQAGIGFVPIAVVSLGLSTRLITRYGRRAMLLLGLALIVGAFVMLSFARVDGAYLVDFFPAGLVMGLGFGLAAPAVMGLGMTAVAPADSGIASGLFNTTQQIGGAIGLTVLSAIVSARTNSLVAAGRTETESLAGAYQVAFLAAAGFALAALIIGMCLLRAAPSTGVNQRDAALAGQDAPAS